jgi:cytochrome c5
MGAFARFGCTAGLGCYFGRAVKLRTRQLSYTGNAEPQDRAPSAFITRGARGIRGPIGCAILCGLVGCAGAAPPSSPDNGANASTQEDLASCSPIDASAGAACAQPGPSFAKDIAPLLQRDCNTCHAPGSTLWPLVGYENVRDWSYAILLDVDGCRMPPADGGTTLSSTDRSLLLAWIACGANNN